MSQTFNRRALRSGALALPFFFCLASPAAAAPVYSWLPESTETLESRFPPPAGFTRLPVADGGFGRWLRGLPLCPAGTPVRLYDGRLKTRRGAHAAVLELDVSNPARGPRDLQQCADAVMRLRAEFLFTTECESEISFNFTSGDAARWAAWQGGSRPRVSGNRVSWRQDAKASSSYASFRAYLDTVFAYAGSASLARQLETVADPTEVEPGDVFIQGGFPGHAVLVVDVVVAAGGERRFLLAQSYMPAQDMHLLQNPANPGSPWYQARSGGPLETPEWLFDYRDLRRFKRTGCELRGR